MQDKSTGQSINTAQKINDTLNLIQKADQIIKSSIENVVLVLGKSSVGKAPFTKWMTQDNTKLILVQPQSEDDSYLMEDSDKKILISSIAVLF